MPLQATSGAASYDAFGGGVPVVPNYIEDVFSTYLYTGNDSTQTITNGIDLSTYGGMTWIKGRNIAYSHAVFDTVRGATNRLVTNATDANSVETGTLTAFNSTGFSIGSTGAVNNASGTFASWTFRKQPKFFDVVTYTGDGTSNRSISHNLGSTPGCIIVKRTDASDSWIVWHRAMYSDPSILYEYYLRLNSTAAIASTFNTIWGNSNNVTSTSFQVSTSDAVNASGGTYVAYLFAHDAGGFGLTGTDNVISCGSYTGTGAAGNAITLGYEPQWLLVKSATYAGQEWGMFDSMRGLVTGSGGDAYLYANSSGAEGSGTYLAATATGFSCEDASARYNNSGDTYIYIAIRRGPMKVPTSGTSVFAPVLNTGTGANTNISSGSFAPDMLWNKTTDHSYGTEVWDKLRGVTKILVTSSTSAEGTSPAGYDLVSFNNTGVTEGANSGSVMNISSWLYVNYMFGRAPSFFDVVCYTGTGVAGRTVAHNLTVAPELIIVKARSIGSEQWPVYASPITVLKILQLNTTTDATTYSGYWNNTAPTSSVFSVGDTSTVNQNGATFVAYLFATCAGVSKVGSYTGTATTLQVDCGFTGGARFVLIKRTDSTGDWYVWDSARGIVSGNDSYLLLNSTAAEVTNTDYIDTYSAGFEISSTAPAAINANGGSFVFFAVA